MEADNSASKQSKPVRLSAQEASIMLDRPGDYLVLFQYVRPSQTTSWPQGHCPEMGTTECLTPGKPCAIYSLRFTGPLFRRRVTYKKIPTSHSA